MGKLRAFRLGFTFQRGQSRSFASNTGSGFRESREGVRPSGENASEGGKVW